MLRSGAVLSRSTVLKRKPKTRELRKPSYSGRFSIGRSARPSAGAKPKMRP